MPTLEPTYSVSYFTSENVTPLLYSQLVHRFVMFLCLIATDNNFV